MSTDHVDEPPDLLALVTTTHQTLGIRASLHPSNPRHVPPHVAILGLETRLLYLSSELRRVSAALDEIRQRNMLKDLRKEWDGSIARLVLISILTYLCLALYMFAMGLEPAFLNAVVRTHVVS